MASGTKGYAGKLLRVDMTTERVWDEPLDEATLRAYVGGTGLGVKILYEEVPPGVQWSDPENRLILATGPLGGTSMGGSGSFSVITKGALTNGAATTQANGFFGAFLRFCGYEAIVVQGAASRWLYLHVHEGGAELLDASALLGKDTWETDDAIKAELGKSEHGMSVFGIGPAGENLVRFAAIAGDKGHAAGHNGTGAVMGSKKLKAIAIDRSRRRVAVHDSKRLLDVSRRLLDSVKGGSTPSDIYSWGTLAMLTRFAGAGTLPTKNYTTNTYIISPEDLEKYGAQYIREHFEAKPNPCWACQLHHCHVMRITEGPYQGEIVEEPEYEGFAAWGPVTGQTQVASTMTISNDVERLGFETNECSWLVSMVMECYEKGIINREDTDGLEMNWGNADATRALLRKIAYREGFGNTLAEGTMRAARLIGGEAPNLAIHTMKGNSPRGHDHRLRWYELFDTSVSSTGTIEAGGGGNRTRFGLPEQGSPFDPTDVVATTAKVKGSMQFQDSLGVCFFNTRSDLTLLCEAVSAATGWDFTWDEAMQVGRRSVNLLKAFNLRHGIGPELDRPSPRYGSTPVDGPAQGVGIMPHWDQMVRDYYQQMGWDVETSRPLPETLRSLGLEGVVADLWT
ncbi:MAG: hypothetical protein HW388_551 [Dehalococcoidia bacterium]|nr:hypothetical protein [Dehalococcoidia bacterium]